MDEKPGQGVTPSPDQDAPNEAAVPDRSETISHVTRPHRRQRKRPHRQHPKRKSPKPEWFLVGLTAIIAVAGMFQAHDSNRAANAAIHVAESADEQFSLSQRPYLLAAVPKVERVGDHLRADIITTNYGRSPAVRVSIAGALITGRPADPDLVFTKLDDGSLKPISSGGMIEPTTGSTLQHYTTARTGAYLASQLNEMLETDDAVTITGRVKYFDFTGRAYQTDFCFSRLATGAMSYCGHHNELK